MTWAREDSPAEILAAMEPGKKSGMRRDVARKEGKGQLRNRIEREEDLEVMAGDSWS